MARISRQELGADPARLARQQAIVEPFQLAGLARGRPHDDAGATGIEPLGIDPGVLQRQPRGRDHELRRPAEVRGVHPTDVALGAKAPDLAAAVDLVAIGRERRDGADPLPAGQQRDQKSSRPTPIELTGPIPVITMRTSTGAPRRFTP